MMRLLIGLILAIVVNFGLFTLMHLMTSTDRVKRQTFDDIRILDFVRVQKEPEVETKQRKVPEKPKPPEKMPPPPKVQPKTQQVKSPTPKLAVPNIKVPLNIAGGPYLGDFSATKSAPVAPVQTNVNEYAQVTPLVRIPPRYPRLAARRGLEGVVRVAFTITKDGLVSQARVLSADPPGVFDAAALKAVRKWKFSPKMVDGKAVEQTAAQEITFRLSK